MTYSNLILLFFLLIGSVSSSQQIIEESLMHEGIERTYILYIPDNYDGSDAWPLLINLHGYTGTAYRQMLYGDFRQIAQRERFLMVLPQGSLDNTGEPYWNAGWVPNGVDDIAFLGVLLDKLISNYNINEERIYSTGMSNGGFMSYTLACEMGHRIAAIASVTGSLTTGQLTGTCKPEHATPIMEIHGTNDEVVPYNGNNLGMAPIDEVMAFWRDRYNCLETITTQLPDIDNTDASTVERQISTDCYEDSSVELLKIIGGGHTWPGAIINIGVTNQDISASEEIWRFFSQYTLNGTISSIEQIQDEEDSFRAYPTIVTDYLHLAFNNSEPRKISLSNHCGLIVDQWVRSAATTTLDLNHLSAGQYFVIIQEKNKRQYQRFLKF